MSRHYDAGFVIKGGGRHAADQRRRISRSTLTRARFVVPMLALAAACGGQVSEPARGSAGSGQAGVAAGIGGQSGSAASVGGQTGTAAAGVGGDAATVDAGVCPDPVTGSNCTPRCFMAGVSCTENCEVACGLGDLGRKHCLCQGGFFMECACHRPPDLPVPEVIPRCDVLIGGDGRMATYRGLSCRTEWDACIARDSVSSGRVACICLPNPAGVRSLLWACGRSGDWFAPET